MGVGAVIHLHYISADLLRFVGSVQGNSNNDINETNTHLHIFLDRQVFPYLSHSSEAYIFDECHLSPLDEQKNC